MSKDLIIRSSSAEFLIFERQTHDKGIQVRFEDGDLWLTQKSIGELFDTTRNNITMHINEIYKNFELDEKSTSKDFLLVQKEGNRDVKRKVLYYNLDMVISVGYRVNSDRAIQFRRWATYVLKEFSKKGYIIDKKRMANGAFFDEDYYDSLLAEIREIRLSNDEILRKTSREVETVDDRIKELLDDMVETMHKYNGVGLAGPQVGVLKRVIVIDLYDGEEPLKLVNPKIIKTKGEQEVEEGCLSFPNEYAKMIRPKEVVVEALNEEGKKVKIVGKDLLAQALAHEIDHLNGVLFIDNMIPGTLEYISPEDEK